MDYSKDTSAGARFPRWVPLAARHYLAHTENGHSIRSLARQNACHPSTILRQVRRFEQRRDDPLIDDALRSLADTIDPVAHPVKELKTMSMERWNVACSARVALTQDRIDQEAKRVLRRLSERGAVMAVACEMETAVIVRETPEGDQLRTAIVDREIAQAIALKDWISCANTDARIARYFITDTGRAALRRLTAQDENAASGFAEAPVNMTASDAWDINSIEGEAGRAARYQAFESPLVGLSRRRDSDGAHFLSRELVGAGERLREDYELAKLAGPLAKGFDSFLASVPNVDATQGAKDGHVGVQAALRDLGDGLADVTYRCCCLLEGLENTEKSMGWSARSGKIVLRIALQRLVRHYEDQGKFAPLIS